MVARALFDLGEATLGLSPELRWSLDEDIARREHKRLFERLEYAGKLSRGDSGEPVNPLPETALEVFMITLMSKQQHVLDVIEQRYNYLLVSLTQEQQAVCPALNEFFEFFTGLTLEYDYARSESIARRELLPFFQACYSGLLPARDCMDAVFDCIQVKKETLLEALQGIVQRLSSQVQQLSVPIQDESPS